MLGRIRAVVIRQSFWWRQAGALALAGKRLQMLAPGAAVRLLFGQAAFLLRER